MFINPNPHGLIKSHNQTHGFGLKRATNTPPPAQHCGGRGEGVASSAALKICLIKTQVTLQLSSKAHCNLRFYVKPLKQKSLLRYLALHF
jgi:hypothetical protein